MARPRRKTSASTRRCRRAQREAAEDLERIENEVKREAEQYVEAVDGDGNEKESVEAAATAFDFDRAEAETEELLIKTTGEADEA